jgi:hypothetical protein
MVSMDEKAANSGDRLKHPLCLEDLALCSKWKKVTYAETHGGAGRYLASGQARPDDHIHRLRDQIHRQPRAVNESSAGGRYLSLLQDWWDNPENNDAYPGSVLQAAIFMTIFRELGSWEVRVTESEKTTFDGLAESLTGYDVELRCDGFQQRMDWLTDEDDLVLLVDPFTVELIEDRDEKENETAKEWALGEGNIERSTLAELLTPCCKKQAAVVMLWSSFGDPQGAERKTAIKRLLREGPQATLLNCVGTRSNITTWPSSASDGAEMLFAVCLETTAGTTPG